MTLQEIIEHHAAAVMELAKAGLWRQDPNALKRAAWHGKVVEFLDRYIEDDKP